MVLLAAALFVVPGCGGGDSKKASNLPDPKDEPTDAAAKPPPGWHTVKNKIAGFTVSAPDSWADAPTKAATAIRSDDKLVVVSIAADRSKKGADTNARTYAAETLKATTSAKTDGKIHTVKGSPYDNAYIVATGKIPGQKVPQTVTTVIYHRKGHVTYGMLIFANAKVKPHFNDKNLAELMRSFRAQSPSSSG
jgi:hypothetical protein